MTFESIGDLPFDPPERPDYVDSCGGVTYYTPSPCYETKGLEKFGDGWLCERCAVREAAYLLEERGFGSKAERMEWAARLIRYAHEKVGL